jgi:hypothetical protein
MSAKAEVPGEPRGGRHGVGRRPGNMHILHACGDRTYRGAALLEHRVRQSAQTHGLSEAPWASSTPTVGAIMPLGAALGKRVASRHAIIEKTTIAG